MFPNAKGSEQLSILAIIDPANLAVGTTNTIWLPVNSFQTLLSCIQTGVLGASATFNAKLQQAIDSAGTGAKDIAGKAITQLSQTTAGSAKQVLINLKAEDLDIVSGYSHVRLSLTIGVAASQVSAQVLGLNPRHASAETFNPTSVVQIV